jgi:hypothetical protein
VAIYAIAHLLELDNFGMIFKLLWRVFGSNVVECFVNVKAERSNSLARNSKHDDTATRGSDRNDISYEHGACNQSDSNRPTHN